MDNACWQRRHWKIIRCFRRRWSSTGPRSSPDHDALDRIQARTSSAGGRCATGHWEFSNTGAKIVALTSATKLGAYEIVSPIGAGGMGEVYRARDERLKRDVAVKVLPASYSQDADRLRRFEHEAQAAGGLNHPNITAVYDLGAHDGAPYIVTELLEGETLRTRLSGGAIPPRKAIDYAVQIARGLA